MYGCLYGPCARRKFIRKLRGKRLRQTQRRPKEVSAAKSNVNLQCVERCPSLNMTIIDFSIYLKKQNNVVVKQRSCILLNMVSEEIHYWIKRKKGTLNYIS